MDSLKTVYRTILSQPHLVISVLLFTSGAAVAFTSLPTLAGALIGGGASLLGAWISDLNSKRQQTEKRKTQEADAINYARPELYRTIEKLLHIHSRALANYNVWFYVEVEKRTGLLTETGDTQVDFIPFLPVLYPNFENLKHLPSAELFTLIRFYDSLYELKESTANNWEREGQPKTNIYNGILQNAHRSLNFSLECLEIFELDKYIPPRYSGWKPLRARIELENRNYESAMERIARRASQKSS
ncbi:hypothetical protein [Pectobacterium carotovorum]|uniref:hypothetical protein n=1 Tax=Pectobacterium carotovorum TaxID=554 RepID=UPI00381E2AFE